MNHYFSLNRVRILFSVALLFLSGLFIFLFLQISNLIKVSDGLQTTSEVNITLQKISTDISQAETAQRAFLLTGDSMMLDRRNESFHQLVQHLNLVDSLVRENPLQTQNMKILHAVLRDKITSMQNIMEYYTTPRTSNAVKQRLRSGVQKMDEVEDAINQMSETESRSHGIKKSDYITLSLLTPMTLIGLFIVAFTLLIYSSYQLYKSLERSQFLKDQLAREKTLAESILQSSLDVIVVYATDTTILYYGKTCETLFGKTRDEVIGRKLLDVFPQTVHTKAYHDLLRAFNGEFIHNDSYHSPLWDRHYENYLIPLRTEEGKVYAVLVVAHDNTEVVKATEKANKQNRAFEEAQRLAKVGSWEWIPGHPDLYWSPYMRHIYGVGYDEPVSFETFSSLLHPDDREMVLWNINYALEKKIPFEFEHRIISRDGVLKQLYARGESILDEKGNVKIMRGTGQDITIQVKNQQLLQESQDKFNKLFQFSPFSITLSDEQEGRLVDVNENFVRTFGFSREEVIGKTSAELNMITAEMRQRILEEIRSSASVRNVEIMVRKKNGEQIPVLVSIERVNIAGNQYYLNAIIDIQERKRAEEKIEAANHRLQRMNKELESFAYISSHDLQEPLRKIQAFSSRLMEKEYAVLSENGKDQFRRIQQAAKRMQKLIEDLLTYSRTNTEIPDKEEIDLNLILKDVLEDFREDIQQKNAVVDAGPLFTANIIPFQFRQLLQNLISNALKFSDASRPPHITITGELFKDHEMDGRQTGYIRISDNGIGFEPDFNEKIFEVFQRLHGRDKYIGTGIGLAIVKKIVENHNGTIRASGELNKGATFDIFIPV